MKTILAAIVAAFTLTIGPAANAAALVPTTTDLRVQPGTSYVFHNGDPIKICVQVTTTQVVDHAVTVEVDQRDNSAASWSNAFYSFTAAPNVRSCFLAAVHVQSGDTGMKLRARALRNAVTDASTSQVLTLRVVA